MSRPRNQTVVVESYGGALLGGEPMKDIVGTLKTVHGVRVVEVTPRWYFSPDLKWQAMHYSGSGVICPKSCHCGGTTGAYGRSAP